MNKIKKIANTMLNFVQMLLGEDDRKIIKYFAARGTTELFPGVAPTVQAELYKVLKPGLLIAAQKHEAKKKSQQG